MMKKRILALLKILGVLASLAVLKVCTASDKDIAVVDQFDAQRYLGRWYEIVRTDNRFQRGKTNAFATYSLNDNGTIKVVNRAYDIDDKEWDDAVGKAKFVDSKDIGRLKVSFFGPFYGAYNVVAIDPDYKYALIFGDKPKYMWILAREKTIPDAIKVDYLAKAKAFGVDIDALVWDKQDRIEQLKK